MEERLAFIEKRRKLGRATGVLYWLQVASSLSLLGQEEIFLPVSACKLPQMIHVWELPFRASWLHFKWDFLDSFYYLVAVACNLLKLYDFIGVSPGYFYQSVFQLVLLTLFLQYLVILHLFSFKRNRTSHFYVRYFPRAVMLAYSLLTFIPNVQNNSLFVGANVHHSFLFIWCCPKDDEAFVLLCVCVYSLFIFCWICDKIFSVHISTSFETHQINLIYHINFWCWIYPLVWMSFCLDHWILSHC